MLSPNQINSNTYASVIGCPYTSINHCGYSPLHREAFLAALELDEGQMQLGSLIMGPNGLAHKALVRVHEAGATLLGVDASDITFLPNCATGLSMIALGYPFEPGDEILSYEYEYPSNHHPWKLVADKGVQLIKIQGEVIDGRPIRWSLEELKDRVTPQTKMIALSHVQFTSGFCADLKALGEFCQEKSIKLVIDATQSVGCLPVYPKEVGIDALVVSGWKWLMGQTGTALMYTTPEFRKIIKAVVAGPLMMEQGTNYLDHSFNPVACGKKFEPSTLPPAMVAGLGAVIEKVINRTGIAKIWDKVSHLQDVLVRELTFNQPNLIPLQKNERGGILSFAFDGDAARVVSLLLDDGIICSARGTPSGKVFIRCAPHFYQTEQDMIKVAKALDSALTQAQDLR